MVFILVIRCEQKYTQSTLHSHDQIKASKLNHLLPVRPIKCCPFLLPPSPQANLLVNLFLALQIGCKTMIPFLLFDL